MFDGPGGVGEVVVDDLDDVLELVFGCTGGTAIRVLDESDDEVELVADGSCGVEESVPGVIKT